jgi:hypothetical protein
VYLITYIIKFKLFSLIVTFSFILTLYRRPAVELWELQAVVERLLGFLPDAKNQPWLDTNESL